MTREQAEIYVTQSLNILTTNSKKFQYKFMLIVLCSFGISAAFYRGLAFIIFVSVFAFLDILFTIVFARKKPQFFKVTLLMGIQLTIFCIALNCMTFGIYKYEKAFVLWEFLVSVIIQIIALPVSYFVVKKQAKNFKPKPIVSHAGAAAAAGAMLVSVISRIFKPSETTMLTFLRLMLSLLACLISFGITGAYYRASLIKKHGLIIEPHKINQGNNY